MNSLDSTRSPMHLDLTLFRRLLDLTSERPWLKRRDEAFIQLLELCVSQRERDLLIDLISRWKYLESMHLDMATSEMAKKAVEAWGLISSETIVTAIADSKRPDGSQALVQAIKSKFPLASGWKESNFFNSLTGSLGAALDSKHIVFVDDFTGTGEKFDRKLKWYKKKMGLLLSGKKEPQYYFISLACMNIGKPLLDSLSIPYYAYIWLERGIADHYTGQNLIYAIEDMRRLEAELDKLPSDYSFGYKGSETLYAQEPYNVPNNVFPIFWWHMGSKGFNRKTLFHRSEES